MGDQLKAKIQESMKQAMRAKDSVRLTTIRMLLAAIKQREIDERITLDDSQILSVIEKMIKQRKDSINQFQQANRQELADKEDFEIKVLQTYLPEQLSAQEIVQLISSAITEANANSMQDMGKVMAIIKPKAQGRADIGEISRQVKAKLAE